MDVRSSSAGVSRDRAARTIVTSYRVLTHACTGVDRDIDRGVLVACSGGADSVALTLALASSGVPVVVGHVVHDLRADTEALSDRDHVRSIATRLGLRFVESAIRVRGVRGNIEANARRARYAALAGLAADAGLGFIATGHHADDVLETLLMRLMRGAGPRGLAGPAPSRKLAGPQASDVWLIRPMLRVARADAERICKLGDGGAGFGWVHDRTNDDSALLRNALRTRVVPILRELSPGVAIRAGHAAELLRDATCLLDQRVTGLLDVAARDGGAIVVDRAALAPQPGVVVGDLLRRAVFEVASGVGLDRIPAAELERAVAAIRDTRGDMRTFGWGDGGRIRVIVHRDRVLVKLAGGEHVGEADRSGGSLRP
jgi:tRNA(Ile)-lysidine synthase